MLTYCDVLLDTQATHSSLTVSALIIDTEFPVKATLDDPSFVSIILYGLRHLMSMAHWKYLDAVVYFPTL